MTHHPLQCGDPPIVDGFQGMSHNTFPTVCGLVQYKNSESGTAMNVYCSFLWLFPFFSYSHYNRLHITLNTKYRLFYTAHFKRWHGALILH